MRCPECGKEMQRELVDLKKDVIEVGMVLPLWAFVYSCCNWTKTITGEEPRLEAKRIYDEKWSQYGKR